MYHDPWSSENTLLAIKIATPRRSDLTSIKIACKEKVVIIQMISIFAHLVGAGGETTSEALPKRKVV